MLIETFAEKNTGGVWLLPEIVFYHDKLEPDCMMGKEYKYALNINFIWFMGEFTVVIWYGKRDKVKKE